MKKLLFSCLATLFAITSFAQIFSNCDNTKNPFDFIGKEHNEALDYIIQHNPNITREYYNENWISLVNQYMSSKGYDTKPFIEAHRSPAIIKACSAQTFYEKIQPMDEARKFLDNKQLSQLRYSKLQELYSVVGNVDNLLLSFRGDANETFGKIKQDILNLENSYSNLSTDDANFCYIASSVLRHSTFYWLNEGSKPHSDWGVPKCNAGGLSVTFSWGSVLAADAGGAVAGAVRTGILGLAGGPISWTAAGIAAAATGIGSSCGNIIYQLFH